MTHELTSRLTNEPSRKMSGRNHLAHHLTRLTATS